MFPIIHGFLVIFCPKEIESEPVSPRIFFSLSLLLWARIYDPKLHGVTIVGERLPKKDIQSPLWIHSVWKLLKKSHFQTWRAKLCKNTAHCLKFTQNVAFEFWYFPPIFVLLKLTCLVTLFDRKLQVFKNSPIGPFLAFLSTQNVNVARFARNVEWDFFCDFQTLWMDREWPAKQAMHRPISKVKSRWKLPKNSISLFYVRCTFFYSKIKVYSTPSFWSKSWKIVVWKWEPFEKNDRQLVKWTLSHAFPMECP